MKTSFLNFFHFSKDDRCAIVAVGCIAVFCLGVLIIADALKEKEEQTLVTDEQCDCEKSQPIDNKEVAFCRFDPNTVDSATLVQFGIKPWKVRNFLHYRDAGKVFLTAEDMGKTHGWTADDVEMLTPYVSIVHTNVRIGKKHAPHRSEQANWGDKPSATMDVNHRHLQNKGETIIKIDANTADSATLCRIPGIGAGISRAILRYRGKLGGFHSTRQLLEISIFSPELLEWFSVSDTSALRKLAINRASFQSLNSHPYITYDQTRSLLKYIRLYGDIDNEQALLSTGIFTAEDMEKLRPYIEYLPQKIR